MTLPLPDLIETACSPARYEADVALNLEICERINIKGGGLPRLAAMTIVRLVNSKRINQAMLALTLLDHCVKNCGYPFHLQIATKEFLNALVRKFPERPPANYSPSVPRLHGSSDASWNHFDYVPQQPTGANPVMSRILYLIKEWKVGLAELSRYKNDLIHIKDMYRLLRYKGYRFPEIREASLSALAPPETLRSADELEEEDRIAQSAKLQELIRRGRPQDLVEANRLMKIMSGYDQRRQTNYNDMFAEELHKIENKATLLYEMLENVKEGEIVDANDMMKELQSACASALPKISKMVKEEEDEDKIEDLLRINDIVNNVIAKYQDIQKGLYNTHYEVNTSGHGTPQPVENQSISLIDLDNDNDISTPPVDGSPAQQTNVMDQLSDLFGEQLNTTSTLQLGPESMLSQPFKPTLSSNNSSPSTPPMDIISNTTVTQSPTVSSQTKVQEQEEVALLDKNGLSVILQVTKGDPIWKVKALFSNKSTAAMENMTLHLAAPKTMQLKLEPQSSQTIPPKSTNSVYQNITITNKLNQSLRLRYKVTYYQLDVPMELTGELLH
ncbi:uncharacterized protein BX664DRAFT_327451 [Halteromyces radiatus]|uniref:uncharacterized protein n=1 Tax=Halteromyces radiatus TaxID=101107 RepID=UPI00221F5CBF|nr:uncharacterized protein BX664DRAFT_327451 [Halteromyces radiatus]KAI8092509.1 hypothetical protein BX664DRAFT_327451 [Halteromyces radiatus]